MKKVSDQPARLTRLAGMLGDQHVRFLLNRWPDQSDVNRYTLAAILVTNPELGNLVLDWADVHCIAADEASADLPDDFGDHKQALEEAKPTVLEWDELLFDNTVPEARSLLPSSGSKHGMGK